jgi:hypothetical protein
LTVSNHPARGWPDDCRQPIGTESQIAQRLAGLWKKYSSGRAQLKDQWKIFFHCSRCRDFCIPARAAEKPMNILVLLAADWRYGCSHSAVINRRKPE